MILATILEAKLLLLLLLRLLLLLPLLPSVFLPRRRLRLPPLLPSLVVCLMSPPVVIGSVDPPRIVSLLIDLLLDTELELGLITLDNSRPSASADPCGWPARVRFASVDISSFTYLCVRVCVRVRALAEWA